MIDIGFDDNLRHYKKNYTQYYTGDLTFTGFVLQSIYDDLMIDTWNDYNYKLVIKILVALLLRKEKLGND